MLLSGLQFVVINDIAYQRIIAPCKRIRSVDDVAEFLSLPSDLVMF